MKKMILVIFTLVLSMSFITAGNALANEKLLNYAKKTHIISGKEIKLSNSDLVKVERFLNQNEVSDKEADEIIGNLSQIIAILDNEKITDITKLSKSKKEEIFNLASTAANVIGAKITYNNTDKTIVIYDKNGKKFDEISANPYLKPTGSSNVVFIVSSLTLLIGTAVIYRKSKNA